MTETTSQPADIPSKSAIRIKGIDICRSVAILLAMWSHVLVTFGTHWEGPSYLWLRFAMQMAPVTFICLFGSMLEVAYGRKFRSGQTEEAVARLLLRAGQCYILYCISVLSLIIVGRYTVGYGVRTMLLIGITPFTDVLKFYALALLVAPFLISLRIRAGLWPLFVAALAIQLAHPLLGTFEYHAPETGKDYLGPVLGFLYGGSDAGVGAPSFLHGMALVCIGMIIGSAVNDVFSSSRSEGTRGMSWLALILALSFSGSILFWNDTGEVLRGIASLTIRNDNHPFYYALGLTTTTSFLILCLFFFDRLGLTFADGIRFIGTTSLFTFSFGNVLLYMQPFGNPSGGYRWVPTILYAILIPLQSWIFFRLINTKRDDRGFASSTLKHVMDRANGWITTAVRPLKRSYLALLERGIVEPF